MHSFTTPTIKSAVDFCWDTQRMLTKARAEAWNEPRLKEYVRSRTQLWRRFSSGVRESAQNIFKDELNEQLATPVKQRNPNKPVWLNEHYGVGTDRVQAKPR